MIEQIKLFSAPLQGYTEAPWRNVHSRIFGSIDTYYAPFLRIDRGVFRNKDIRDIAPERNDVAQLIPQIIGSNPAETKVMIDKIIELGYQKVDLNLGCPFPLIANRHKGSGMLPYQDEVKALIDQLLKYSNLLEFSVKMRTGWKDNTECIEILPYLNMLNPTHVTLHPRLGVQQYKGEPDIAAFELFYSECKLPLIYNGDVTNIEKLNNIVEKYPKLKGVMIGRGLLYNPSIAREYYGGAVATGSEILSMHSYLLDYYSSILQGDTQLLLKMKSYWEYFMPELDKKLKKAIKKSSSMTKYHAAIQNVRIECE